MAYPGEFPPVPVANPNNVWGSFGAQGNPINTDWMSRLSLYTDPNGKADYFSTTMAPAARAQTVLGALGLGGGANPFYRYLQDLAPLQTARYQLATLGQVNPMTEAESMARQYLIDLGSAPGESNMRTRMPSYLRQAANAAPATLTGYDEDDQLNMAYAGLESRYAPSYRRALRARLENEKNAYLHDAANAGVSGGTTFLKYLEGRGWF